MSSKAKAILNEDVVGLYELVTLHDKPEAWCVKLLDPDWYGIVYTYGKVSLKEEGENLRCSLEYDIIYTPERLVGLEFPDEKRVEFETLLGKIAMNILYDSVEDLEASDEDASKLVIKK